MTLRGLRKAFGETTALDELDLDVVAGELLGVAGPNGAGKSTLVRVLAGEEQLDAGEILVNDQPWLPGNPADPVAVVHQEPQLWSNLTLAQNLLVGREGSRFAFPELPEHDRLILEQLEIASYANWPLDQCTLAVRQRAEIARALARDARFFLFDEPNSALTEEESNELFAWMHELCRQDRIVMLISHRLGELVAHADRIAVVRDGRVRAQLRKSSLTEEQLARELVVGHASAESLVRGAARDAEVTDQIAAVKDWTHVRGAFNDVELEIRRGEVVAVVGVEGSGARELVASLAGYEHATGTVSIGSRGSGAIETDTAYLGADRRANLFANLSVGDNLVIRLGPPDIATRSGFLRGTRRRLARELVDRYRIRAQAAEAPLPSLSGGNQQKVAIAAAIARRPAVLALEEPTRGVDVGSKGDIYRLLHEFAAEGNGVLAYCTEVPEVFELADRVIVVDKGRIGATFMVDAFPDVTALAEVIAGVEHTDALAASAPLSSSGEAALPKNANR